MTMQKFSTLLLSLILCVAIAQGQTIGPLNPTLWLVNKPCPTNPNVIISGIDKWTIYQTMDGSYNGRIDSSRCINAYQSPNNYSIAIPINQIDTTRPLFVRCNYTDSNRVFLQSNSLYNLYANLNSTNPNYLTYGTNAPDGLVSGVILGIQVPNETNTGFNMRITPIPLLRTNSVTTCIATERFSTNYLREFIYKIKVRNTAVSDSIYLSYYSSFRSQYRATFIDSIPIPEQFRFDTIYGVSISRLFNPNFSYLVRYPNPLLYPSAANLGYVEVYPKVNSTSPRLLELNVYSYDKPIIFQPFTQFRPGLVSGSSTVRHNLNFINNGGSICLFGNDLVTGGSGNNFVYKAGNIDFGASSSCMMFKDGGNLVIGEGATFNYGNDVTGLLAIQSGSSIVFEKNGVLNMNGKLIFNHDFSIHLKSGNKLNFARGSHLVRGGNLPVVLYVYMEGGELDDSYLSVAERAAIVRIYPKRLGTLDDNTLIFPNPVEGSLTVQTNLTEAQIVEMDVVALNGVVIQRVRKDLPKGLSQTQIGLEDLDTGLYLLRIRTGDGVVVKKLSKF
jgi:Secretion system C-terminal sorting domain